MYSKFDLLELYNDADFYDAEFNGRSFELDFYKSACKNFKNILEVACGTGRITIPLAKSGVNIVGKDISPEMILKAKKNSRVAGTNINFSIEDACYISGRHDLIFIATNAMQHLINSKDVLKFLRSCKLSLLPKGRVIVDIQTPNIRKLIRDDNEVRPYKEFNYLGNRIKSNIQSNYDHLTQIYEFQINYYHNNEMIKKKRVAMRMYYPQEIQHLFSVAGLSIFEAYGNYDKSKLSSSSEKQIYILK